MTVGQNFDFEGNYKITREEIIEFARKYDPQPFHVDESAAAKTMYGGLIASGWHTCAVAMRLLCDGFMNQSTGIGSPGVDEIRWIRPVRPGDELKASLEILEVTPSRSKPDRGSIKHKLVVTNQLDEVVMIVTGITMMRRRVPAD
ncbi:MAG: MaoC family dehydratase [Alphaproteobacteria bacterium]|nr:MAG: MaoC family dehydratase [Alphaproteobacteria bacterium]